MSWQNLSQPTFAARQSHQHIDLLALIISCILLAEQYPFLWILIPNDQITKKIHSQNFQKKDAWLIIMYHTPLRYYFDMKLLHVYARCISSASISFNSSNDNDGTQSAISSSDIFPFFIILSAVALSAS